MPLDRPLQKELSPIIKNMSIKLRKDRLRKHSSNTTELFWLLIQEDVSPKNMEDLVLELEFKNLIDDLNLFNFMISKIG